MQQLDVFSAVCQRISATAAAAAAATAATAAD